MPLSKRAIEWKEDAVAQEPAAPAFRLSPALELQQMLRQRSAILAQPPVSRDVVRRLVITSVAGASALWLALIVSTRLAVALIA